LSVWKKFLPVRLLEARQLVVQCRQQRGLLGRGGLGERLAGGGRAAGVHVGEAVEEALAVVRVGPVGEHHVDELVHARRFGAGRVGLGDDQLGERRDQRLLVGVEDAEAGLRAPVVVRVTAKGVEIA